MMTTLALNVSEYEKQAVKERAAAEGKSVESLMLEAIGVREKGTIYEAEKDLKEGRYEEFENFEELTTAIRSW